MGKRKGQKKHKMTSEDVYRNNQVKTADCTYIPEQKATEFSLKNILTKKSH